jgi:hypothetical protein
MHRYLSSQLIKFVRVLINSPIKRTGNSGLYALSGVIMAFLGMAIIASPKAFAANTPPTISMEAPAIAGDTVTIIGTAKTTTPGASIVSISWDWGDHNNSVSMFPAEHTYAGNGRYVITATAKDSNGLIASASEVLLLPPNMPFYVIQGGDARGGFSFGPANNSCSPWNGTMFSSWNNNNANGAGYYGGAEQDADFVSDVSFDVVTDMNSAALINPANYNYTLPLSPSYLGFANVNQDFPGHHDNYPVDYAAGYYGGGFFPNSCQTEKYVQTMDSASGTIPLTAASSGGALTGGNSIDLSALKGGNYSFNGTLYVDDNNGCGCSMPVTWVSEAGVPITIAVTGNVYIDSDILYSYTDPSKIPQVNIYAGSLCDPTKVDCDNVDEGNIFVQNTVSEIHGNFTAEGTDLDNTQAYNLLEQDFTSPTSFTDGLFSDCAEVNAGVITSTANYDPCHNQLKIVGSIGANVYFLERSYGDLNAITPNSTNAENAAEIFQYSPELWLPDAIDTSCVAPVAQCIGTSYESVTNLPPSL